MVTSIFAVIANSSLADKFCSSGKWKSFGGYFHTILPCSELYRRDTLRSDFVSTKSWIYSFFLNSLPRMYPNSVRTVLDNPPSLSDLGWLASKFNQHVTRSLNGNSDYMCCDKDQIWGSGEWSYPRVFDDISVFAILMFLKRGFEARRFRVEKLGLPGFCFNAKC